MSLRDEVVAETKTGGNQCATCTWLAALDAGTRREWTELINDRSFTVNALSRVMQKHGSTVSSGALRNHRAHPPKGE